MGTSQKVWAPEWGGLGMHRVLPPPPNPPALSPAVHPARLQTVLGVGSSVEPWQHHRDLRGRVRRPHSSVPRTTTPPRRPGAPLTTSQAAPVATRPLRSATLGAKPASRRRFHFGAPGRHAAAGGGMQLFESFVFDTNAANNERLYDEQWQPTPPVSAPPETVAPSPIPPSALAPQPKLAPAPTAFTCARRRSLRGGCRGCALRP